MGAGELGEHHLPVAPVAVLGGLVKPGPQARADEWEEGIDRRRGAAGLGCGADHGADLGHAGTDLGVEVLDVAADGLG